MAIGTATEKAGLVNVFDEKGNFLFTKTGSLKGYTGSTVSVEKGGLVHTYDEKGTFKFSKSSS